jgi:N-alpha-acetyl-L-2,4-diaminobutyrate deacetylase
MAAPRVRITLDLRAPGKARGQVLVPISGDESAYGYITLPITVIAGGAGPTILLTGGVHGDEYEGPILLARLANELEPQLVTGRLLILPALNPPALEAGRRTSPLDGLNLNRVFPGRLAGGPTELIAHVVAEQLLPECDVLVDLHSGGRSLLYTPLAATHLLDEPEHDRRALAALRAFGAPYSLVAHDLDSHGLLDHTAEAMGKLVVSTELGGGGMVSPRALRIGDHGVRRLLRHLGVLTDDLAPQPGCASRLIEIADHEAYAFAPVSGIYEPCIELEEMVATSDTLGLVHPVASNGEPPRPVQASRPGILICRRAQGCVRPGDCVALVASELSSWPAAD